MWSDALRFEAEHSGRVVAVGHSWGGYLARLALWDSALLVAGAVLLDGGCFPWVDPNRSLAEEIAQGRELMARAVTAGTPTRPAWT